MPALKDIISPQLIDVMPFDVKPFTLVPIVWKTPTPVNSSLVGVESEKTYIQELVHHHHNIPPTMTSSQAERGDDIDVSSIIEESWQIDDIPYVNDVSSVEPLPAPVESPACQNVDNRIILRTLNSLYQFVLHVVQSGAIGPPRQSSELFF